MGYKSSCEYIGPKGEKGMQGEIGLIGNKGDKGVTGDTGDVGLKGERGNKGIAGDIGDIGDVGLTGDPGGAGDTGDIGDTGERGDRGSFGDTGATGEPGPKGERGDKGIKGDIGLKGDTGPVGENGRIGPIGDIGPKGPTGDKGATGEKGPNGQNGPMGNKGDTGEAGDIGLPGPIGVNGEKGNAGIDGEKGIKAYQRISSGEIIIRKMIEFARQTSQRCFINTTYSTTSNIEGLGKIENASVISELKYDCAVFDKVDVKVDKIASISFVTDNQNSRDNIVLTIKDMIRRTSNCETKLDQVRGLTDEGIAISGIDVSIDFDFFVQCNCVNDTFEGAIIERDISVKRIGNCLCQAKRINLCKKEEDETSILRKRIEVEMDNGRAINSMLIYSGDFTDLSTKNTNIKIEVMWHGAGFFSYATSDNEFILTVTNLDKICYVDFA